MVVMGAWSALSGMVGNMNNGAIRVSRQPTKVGQGDIIHRPAPSPDDKHRWGFIVTADCDIAKDKAGARLSYLEIVTIRDYLENIWSAEELRKLRPKVLKDAAPLLTKAAKLLGTNFCDLSDDELLKWLKDSPAKDIVAELKIALNKQKQHIGALELVELVFAIRTEGKTALQRLLRIWDIQNNNSKVMLSRLQEALNYNKATDFHIILDIPGSDPLGYVVLLREVSSIQHAHVYASALDLQIEGSEEGFYVAGPSSDNLRYAISQKMAFLFSRIGMSDEYEDNCGVAIQLSIDELATHHKIAGQASDN